MRSDEIKVNELYRAQSGFCVKVLEVRVPWAPYKYSPKTRTGVRCEIVRSSSERHRAASEIMLPARDIMREWTREDTERFEQARELAARLEAIVQGFREKFGVELASLGGRMGLRMTADDGEHILRSVDAGLDELTAGEEDSPQIAG